MTWTVSHGRPGANQVSIKNGIKHIEVFVKIVQCNFDIIENNTIFANFTKQKAKLMTISKSYFVS